MGMVKSRFTGNKTVVVQEPKQIEEPGPPPLTAEELCANKLEELTASLDCFENEIVDLQKDITDALQEENPEKSDPEDEHQHEWLQHLNDEGTKLDQKTSKHLQYKIATKQEVLMQKLLSTDAINAPTDDMRVQRKEIVKRIQELEKKLDTISKAIQKITVVESDQKVCEEANENPNETLTESPREDLCADTDENTREDLCVDPDGNTREEMGEDLDENTREELCEDQNPDQKQHNGSGEDEDEGQSLNVDNDQ